jgi:hypothetical protein
MSLRANSIAVRMKAMSEGSERLAYGMTELMCDDEHYEAVGIALVAKEGVTEGDLLMDPFEYHRNFCRSQIKSDRYAEAFNRQLAGVLSPDEIATTPVIRFVKCSVYRVNTPDGSDKAYLVEKRLDMKKWAKFNNNRTFVMKEEEFVQRYPMQMQGEEEEEQEEQEEVNEDVVVEEEEEEEEEVIQQAQDEDEDDDELHAPPVKRRVTFADQVEFDGEGASEDEQEYDEDVGYESDVQDEASGLPAGWESGYDPEEDRIFYHNKSLNVSQWEYPGGAESRGSSPARSCSYSPSPRSSSPEASYYQSPNDRRKEAETLRRGGGDSQSPPRMRSSSPQGAHLLIAHMNHQHLIN